MLNDVMIIAELTGFTPGTLEIYEKSSGAGGLGPRDGRATERYDGKLYDESTGNFHIVPDSKRYVSKIGEARKRLVRSFKELMTKGEQRDFVFNFRRGASAASCIEEEKYIAAERGDSFYMLCFERLFTDGKTVNCALGLFQFYKLSKSALPAGVNKSSPKVKRDANGKDNDFKMCYPESAADGASKTVDRKGYSNTVCNSGKLPTVFEVALGVGIEEVCGAFLEFIEQHRD